MKLRDCLVVALLMFAWHGPILASDNAAQTDRAAKANATTEFGQQGTHFTLNGNPTFLLGLSYYGALGASEQFIQRDLDDLQRHGFNWIRVWATWAAFEHDVSAVDAQGGPREPYLKKLQWLVAECDRRGIVVDVTLTRGKRSEKSLTGGNLPDFAAHRRAVETIISALKPHHNWYLDLANERDVRDARYVDPTELKTLRDLARRLDSSLLVTASFGGHDLSQEDVRDALLKAGVDFLAPHRPRNPQSPGQTAARTRDLLKITQELGSECPIHHQEPFRRGYTGWEPTATDFLTDLRGAVAGGAAGWCFHNGSQRTTPDNQPRRSFDLRERRLFDQLDAEELKLVAQVKAVVQDNPAQPVREEQQDPTKIDPAKFDHQIAPLLTQRCLNCHNATTKKGGLDLSQSATALAGGESGTVIVPGKPNDSLLWERIAADEMPPKHPLPAVEKQLLRQWIVAGAHWGSDPIDPFRFTTDKRAGYDWWSLQPVKRPNVPAVRNAAWPRNEIDRFILAKLEAEGLAPAAQADPRTLIRRLYFDLIGLPPILKEEGGKLKEELLGLEIDLASFPQQTSAYASLVDQLLNSPHYGERWARHWLDVIRFGESQGFERNRIRENAWRYRDWVVQSFNQDLPYDEFVRQQIAGDVLHPTDLDALLATGFLVCGTWDQVGHNEGSAEMRKAVRQDDLEDLVAALGQSFLGLTINCARCHDHKFDPISQQEYYQTAALLGGVTQEEKERQGITAKPSTEAHRQWTQVRDARRGELAALEKSLRDQYGKSGTGTPIEGLQVLYIPGDLKNQTLTDQSGVGDPLDLVTGGESPFASTKPATKLIAAAKATNEFTIEAWVTPAKANQSGPARIVTLSLDSGQRNFTLGQDGDRFDLRFRTTKTDQNGMPSLASPNGRVVVKKTHVVCTFDRKGDVRCFVNGQQVATRNFGGDLSNWNDGFRLALGDELSGERRWDGQFHFVALYNKALSVEQIIRNFESESRDVRAGEALESLLAKASDTERSRYTSLRNDLQRLEQSEPAQPFDGVAHVIIPKQPPVFHILARGDYRNPGQVVPPAGLRALSRGGLSPEFGLKPDSPEAERRGALAKWLADPRNPLTPRVLVNRLWHYHFGRGIVDTPSDFGFAGGRPSHLELLDWLTDRFVSGGWKIKDMHRLIVMSATYRQASNVVNPQATATDAENRLLWRANSTRLDGEAVRDAVLTVSGALNNRLGGPSYRDMQVNGGKMGTNAEFTDPTGEFTPDVNRRTIYRLWARSGNNPLLESLDCPDPSVMSPRRTQTITPVQSLSLLNSSFMEHCAKQFAERVRREVGNEIDPQIARVYQLALGRTPTPRELQLARGLVQKRGLHQLCLVLFNTNEFLFVE